MFIIFNRADYTSKVFERIREAKPKYLFVAADGARNSNEIEKCNLARQVVINGVDWPCEVKTLFRVENLGCGLGPANAITWFFENVEQGIILEDDCKPAPEFFLFCEQLLNHYKFDERIQSISGTNQFVNWNKGNASYFFSRQSGIWGWATWRRAWKDYDFYVKNWRDADILSMFNSRISNPAELKAYTYCLEKAYSKKDVTWWDYQWIFSRIITSRVGIIPSCNLITNIGFGEDASHTFDSTSLLAALPLQSMNFPLKHPETIMADSEFDDKHSLLFYPVVKHSKFNQLKNILKRLLKKQRD